MDKIQIATKDRSLVIKMGEEEANAMFMKLSASLLLSKTAVSLDGEQIDKSTKAWADKESEKKVQKTESAAASSYRGFLYIRCEHCGKEKAFSTKDEIDSYFCAECEGHTEFHEPLAEVQMRCECGRGWHYMTNMKENSFDIPCIACGSPVAVAFNEKKGIYESMR